MLVCSRHIYRVFIYKARCTLRSVSIRCGVEGLGYAATTGAAALS